MSDNFRTILAIEDDPDDARLLSRNLQKLPEITVNFLHYCDPEEGLRQLARRDVDMVFLDYRLGALTGLELLERIRDAGDVRPVVVLTGQGAEDVAVELMRAGADDYIVKANLNPDVLRRSMDHAHQRYLRRQAENGQRDLLAKTLSASVQMLVDILHLLQPECFGRATRVSQIVREICAELELENTWEVDVAAKLSQLGCLQVPRETLQKACQGEDLSFSEKRTFWKHPQVAADLINRIPRLQGVAQIVAYQEKHFDGDGPPLNDVRGKDIPLGARILKLALDFDARVTAGNSNYGALEIIRSHRGRYDPDIIEILAGKVGDEPEYGVRWINLSELKPEMIFGEHVLSRDGAILVRNGKTVTGQIIQRLREYNGAGSFADRIRQPIRVRVPIHYDRDAEKHECDSPQQTPV